jgi:hypothetical protein
MQLHESASGMRVSGYFTSKLTAIRLRVGSKHQLRLRLHKVDRDRLTVHVARLHQSDAILQLKLKLHTSLQMYVLPRVCHVLQSTDFDLCLLDLY